MADLQLTGAFDQLFKADTVIVKHQPFKQASPGGSCKKGVVTVFGHINAHDQIFAAAANLGFEWTVLAEVVPASKSRNIQRFLKLEISLA